jgi:hypothetical protein
MPVMPRLHLLQWTDSRLQRRDCFDPFMMLKLVRPCPFLDQKYQMMHNLPCLF